MAPKPHIETLISKYISIVIENRVIKTRHIDILISKISSTLHTKSIHQHYFSPFLRVEVANFTSFLYML